MPRLVLVRHAEVARDPASPVESWPLSPKGARAASLLGSAPEVSGVSAVWSSPEPKALATAHAIWPGLAVQVRPDLRELDRRAVGWVGDEAAYAALVGEILSRPDESVRGCEPAREVERRVCAAIGEILAAEADDVAVVSHGLALTAYVSGLLGLPAPSLEIWRSMRFPDLAIVDRKSERVLTTFGQIPR